MIKTPDIVPFNPLKKLNDDNDNLYKCNCLIILDVIFKYLKII
jgi:hypothetical protein